MSQELYVRNSVNYAGLLRVTGVVELAWILATMTLNHILPPDSKSSKETTGAEN